MGCPYIRPIVRMLCLVAVVAAFAPGTLRRIHLRRHAIVGMSTADEPPQLYHVQLYNDDRNKREYVARVLMCVADLSAEEANAVMQRTNRGGRAIVGTWEREVAEHVEAGMKKAGLSTGLDEVGMMMSRLGRLTRTNRAAAPTEASEHHDR